MRVGRVLDASDPRILAQERSTMTASTKTKPMSDAQRDLIVRLAAERDFDLSGYNLDELTGGRNGTASALITKLFTIERANPMEGTTKVDPEPGFYRVGDDVVQVRLSRSGNWYAQLAVIRPGASRVKWDYLGRRIDLANAQAMTEAEAGRFTTFCMRCNARLDDQTSRDRGYGPTCWQRVNAGE